MAFKYVPEEKPERAAQVRPSVLDMLEAMGTEYHDAHDLRDDLPLIVKHGPLRFRDKWNARFET